MNPIYLIAASAVIVGAVTFWSLFASWKHKLLATVLFFVVGGLNFVAGFDLMGIAKPRNLEWRNLQDTRIVTYFWTEDVAIYMIIMRNGEPVMYKLPWKVKKAEEMQNEKTDLNAGVPQFFRDEEDENGQSEDVIETKKPVLPPKDVMR